MATERTIRILIVDDSAVTRRLLTLVVSTESRIEVAGVASNGAEGLEAIDRLSPDLVLLDVEMPAMDGLTVLEKLRERRKRLPVIMCSTLTSRGASVTIEALARGATDYVTKPSGQSGIVDALAKLKRELVPKILAICSQPSESFSMPSVQAGIAQLVGKHYPLQASETAIAPTVVVVGVSTGGPAALEQFLPALPASFALPILLVQHMPQLFTRMLAERLNTRCSLPVHEATAGGIVEPGHVYLAPGDWHMEVGWPYRVQAAGTADSFILRLRQGPAENHCRPSVNALFRSAASIYGAGVLAVILTGMGSDGLEGCRAVRAAGGTVLAQDQESSVVWGMPGSVVGAGLAHRVLPLSALAPEVLRRCGHTAQTGRALAEQRAI